MPEPGDAAATARGALSCSADCGEHDVKRRVVAAGQAQGADARAHHQGRRDSVRGDDRR